MLRLELRSSVSRRPIVWWAVRGLAVTVLAAVASGQSDPGVRTGPAGAGGFLPNLTPAQQTFFNEGLDAFQEIDFVQNPPAGADAGLGPRFNLDSCAGCHAFPAVGGSSPAINPQIAVATKLGARNTVPPFITLNGPVREVRFIKKPDGSPDGGVHDLFVISGRSDAGACNIRQEDFSNTSNLSFRIPTPTFGAGLIEAVSDTSIRQNMAANSFLKGALGIRGKLNTNGNDGTITRFGWKAQNKSLHIFAGEAYNVEQGVSNMVFPQERDETPGCVFTGGFEDGIDTMTELDDATLFAGFMRFLAPPARGPITPSVQDGANIFNAIGCAFCHTPSLQTGLNSMAVLSNKPVPLYSDLAVHNMGDNLADDISQGLAGGDEFRSAPLWGLGKRIFFLHDGRTTDLTKAIEEHFALPSRQYGPSEANGVILLYRVLPRDQKQHLLDFLRSL